MRTTQLVLRGLPYHSEGTTVSPRGDSRITQLVVRGLRYHAVCCEETSVSLSLFVRGLLYHAACCEETVELLVRGLPYHL